MYKQDEGNRELDKEVEKVLEEEITTNVFGKVVNIVIAPSKALRGIKEKPTILLALFIGILLPALYYILFWGNIELQMIQVLEDQAASMGTALTAEMLELQLKIVRWTTPLTIAVGPVFGGLITALYYFICSKIAKSALTFKQAASIAFHVGVISSLASVLYMVFSVVGLDFNISEPLTSLASLLPNSLDASVLHGVLLPIEVFNIWGLFVTYLGLRIVGEMSNKAATISVGIALAFGVLISGGVVFINQLFANMM